MAPRRLEEGSGEEQRKYKERPQTVHKKSDHPLNPDQICEQEKQRRKNCHLLSVMRPKMRWLYGLHHTDKVVKPRRSFSPAENHLGGRRRSSSPIET
jgi:hypothetical protein